MKWVKNENGQRIPIKIMKINHSWDEGPADPVADIKAAMEKMWGDRGFRPSSPVDPILQVQWEVMERMNEGFPHDLLGWGGYSIFVYYE